MSGPYCHDSPVWPCTGAFYPCTATNPRESISVCRRDDLVIATVNVTPKRRITPVRNSPAPREGACGEQKSQPKQGAPSAPS